MSATGSSPEQPGGGIQMTEGIMGIIQPAIERLDAQVHNTRASQYALNAQIQALAQYLKEITNEQATPYDLDLYVRKLDDSRKRVNAVASVLQNVHDRMSRLQRNIARETYRQKQNLTQAPPLPPPR
uniref:Biogenesis of lysosome-related organelles complex 1 subunit 7 n=2 Tax=Ascaris TaxID=6251 RepID=A0A0M3I240_ASCLU